MSLLVHLFRGGVLGGSVVDPLASQGSLAYEDEKARLIAVNAGSNTIIVRAVDGYRLLGRQVLPRRRLDRGYRERSSPGVAGVAVLYLAGTLAAQGTVPPAPLAPPCEGDRSDRQCRAPRPCSAARC
jgi:hypothetical protein